MMKALVRHRYGGPGVVRVEEVERPALEDDRVLVRVRASGMCSWTTSDGSNGSPAAASGAPAARCAATGAKRSRP